ncbi:MAG: Gfo/Idh/MocA family oxidoreductase [Ignavibacteria bacterium]|nr:Gfo/Idh/MocA family oxidoreductase [Ignavibacteria bacterium]
MEKLKIGIIGAGAIAQVAHLPTLKKLQNVEISAICDIDKLKVNSIAQKFSIPNVFTDIELFLSEAEYDAVFILTPTNTHKDIIFQVANSCKNVLVEKPIARTYKEAIEIKDYVRQRKVKLMVGMNMRFRPDAMILKSMIDSDQLGEPYLMKVGWFKPRSSMQSWFLKPASAGGGVIIDLGISVLDLILWLCNYPEIDSITSRVFYHNNLEVEDSACAFIKTKNQKVFTLEVSWTLNYEREIFFCNAFGTNGCGFLNPLRIFKDLGESNLDLTPLKAVKNENLFAKSYENEIKHFISSVRGLSPWVCSADEAVSRMNIIESFYKSAKLDKEVKISSKSLP